MIDIVSSKNIKPFEEEEQENIEEIKKGYAFLNESECISNILIEKIISMVMTEITKNKIDKLIPNYCFDEIKETLQIVTQLDFITHEKDDIKIKKKLPFEKIKSAINRKKDNSIQMKRNEEKLNNSENLRKYKLQKKLNINVLDDNSLDLDVFNLSKSKLIEKELNEEKIIMGFLTREKAKEINTSFQKEKEKKRKKIKNSNKNNNYNFIEDKDRMFKEINEENEPFQLNEEEKIENIKNVEIHKIDFSPSPVINNKLYNNSVPFDSIVDSTNFWSSLSEPLPPPIDRDAATKIKHEKIKLPPNKRKLTIRMPKEQILEEQKNPNNKTEKPQKKKIKFNFSSKKDESSNGNKKKKFVQIEFESYDLDPKKYKIQYETEETAELRLNLEKELQEKKIEMDKIAKKEKERLAKEEEVAELRKELGKKNVTVDIKGELVFIKPLDLRALNEDFSKGRSNFRNIKTIETDANYSKTKTNLIVEKNPIMNIWDLKDDKNKKKLKKKKEYLLGQKGNNNLNNTPSTNSKKLEKKEVFDKNSMKFAAGSNFEIINPEIGVNIKEEKKLKSGGKDFYKKFNKFSLEIFQDQLSKTVTSNFFPKIQEQLSPSNNENNRRGSLSIKEKIKKDIVNTLTNNRRPNEDNNTISLKTDNLKIALENLDLISERQEKKLHKMKLTKNNFLKKNVKTNKKKSDYKEMNIFTKTLMGSQNWGGELYTESRKILKYKIPTKPEENELQRELPISLLKHMPRKRLPPIMNSFRANTMGQTFSGFYSQRKSNKFRDLIEDNKKSVKSLKSQ